MIRGALSRALPLTTCAPRAATFATARRWCTQSQQPMEKAAPGAESSATNAAPKVSVADSAEELPEWKATVASKLRWSVKCETLAEALEMRRLSDGPKHPNTLAVMNAMAGVHREAGKYEEEIAVLDELCELTADLLESADDRAVVARYQRGVCLLQLKREADAVAQMEEVLPALPKSYGATHDNTIVVWRALANAYGKTKAYDKQVDMLQRLVEAHDKKCGVDAPDTAILIAELAAALEAAGFAKKVAALLSQRLPQIVAGLGWRHPASWDSVRRLAAAYGRLRNRTLQTDALKSSYDVLVAEVGKLDRIALVAQRDVVIGTSDRPDAMAARLMELAKEWDDVFGIEDPDTLLTMHCCCHAWRQARNWEKAESAYRTLIEHMDTALGATHPTTQSVVHELHDVCEQRQLGGIKKESDAPIAAASDPGPVPTSSSAKVSDEQTAMRLGAQKRSRAAAATPETLGVTRSPAAKTSLSPEDLKRKKEEDETDFPLF